jgi:glyoxylase-like metal-dependent hydrolase (beta-lactamase superfamily II)
LNISGAIMQLGDFELHTISGGTFWIDGGSMFGVVPRTVWTRYVTVDDKDRIPQRTNCVLVQTGSQNVLIDTGYGSKLTEKERKNFNAEAGEPLVASLAAVGLTAADIDMVILSHLHFDHAGGATKLDGDGRVVPAFPKATYVAQRQEWATASAEFPELRAAYSLQNFRPLQEAGQLRLIDGNVEILPGLKAWLTGGHTEAHQAIVIESAGQGAIYLGDVCPTFRHLPTLWCIAYDVELLKLRRIKPEVLGTIADHGWWALSDHDPDHAAAKLRRDDKRDFAVTETLPVL